LDIVRFSHPRHNEFATRICDSAIISKGSGGSSGHPTARPRNRFLIIGSVTRSVLAVHGPRRGISANSLWDSDVLRPAKAMTTHFAGRHHRLPTNAQLGSEWTISLSVVSEARVSKVHTRVRCVCALSIQRLEGNRWRLRQMRTNGYGNSIFLPICKLLVLRYLGNEHVREPQFDALRWGMTCGE
jgi:hypothetical protein